MSMYLYICCVCLLIRLLAFIHIIAAIVVDRRNLIKLINNVQNKIKFIGKF